MSTDETFKPLGVGHGDYSVERHRWLDKIDPRTLSKRIQQQRGERIALVEQELRECEARIDHFIKKYDMHFETFERKIEAREFVGAAYQEDYHGWCFWHQVRQRLEDVLQGLRQSSADSKEVR